MQLPSVLPQKSTHQTNKLFLCIVVSDHQVQASLWTPKNNQIEVLARSEVHHYQTDEDCLQTIDEACQELGPESESANEVVFGFDQTWIQQDGLTPTKKPLIKNVTNKLSLSPVGFVSIVESLAQQLITENPSLSTVVSLTHEDKLIVIGIKQGVILADASVGRSDSIVSDLTEALARLKETPPFTDQYFPGQLLLCASDSAQAALLESQQQAAISSDWSRDLPFVHQPVVHILPLSTIIEATTHQGGLAVARAQQLIRGNPSPNRILLSDVGSPADMLPPELEGVIETDESSNLSNSTSDFSVGNLAEQTAVPETAVPTTASSFGVPIDTTKYPLIENQNSTLDEDLNPTLTDAKPKIKHLPIILTGVGVGLIATLAIGFGVLWQTFKIQVTATPATKLISTDTVITLDPKATKSDPEKLILKAELSSIEVEGEETMETTGTKLVGEKAKGKATILNKTTSEKQFPKGTVLSQDKISFVLDQDVTVASASVKPKSDGSGEEKEYGKTDVNITASAIGAESNLVKETQLKVATFDAGTYAAVLPNDLTSGSSRELRIVATEDQNKLKKLLVSKLTQEAADKMHDQSVNGTYLIASGKVETVSANFDSAVGNEAETVSLKLKMKVAAIVYKSDDLRPFAAALLANQIPTGYSLIDQDPEILSAPAESASQSGSVQLIANIQAKAQANITPTEITQLIVGKSIQAAQGALNQETKLNGSKISTLPAWMARFSPAVPTNSSRVQVNLTDLAKKTD